MSEVQLCYNSETNLQNSEITKAACLLSVTIEIVVKELNKYG